MSYKTFGDLDCRFIDKAKNTWENNAFTKFISLGDAQRSQLRITTIAGAAKGKATVVIATMGILTAVSILGVPTGSVLAIGGLLGLAISLLAFLNKLTSWKSLILKPLQKLDF